MRINNKGKLIIGLFSFFLLTPLVVFYVLDGTGVFDTRSRAGDTEELSAELKKADLNGDNKITISDFGIWLTSYRDYKANAQAFTEKADLNDDGAITIMDFSLWLNAYRTYKGGTVGEDLTGLVNYNWGSGADGALSIIEDTNLDDAVSSCAGGYSPSYNVSSFGSNGKSAVISSSPGTCLKAGDEVLLINVQGGSSTLNVGNHEILKVASVAGSTVTFTTAKIKYYGSASKSDAGIGTDCGSQIVVMQRIPQFTNVTVATGKTLSVKGWNGSTGGILVFKASGTVNINGSIDVTGDGFRGGVAGEYSGEGMSSCSLKDGVANFGGAGIGAFGGAYATRIEGTGPGLIYGASDLSKVYLGSGGSSKDNTNGETCRSYYSSNAASGGGLVFILAKDINVNGTLIAKGGNGVHANSVQFGTGGNAWRDCYSDSGSGSGGSVKLVGENVTMGAGKVLVAGGIDAGNRQAGAGGVGRIAVYYTSVVSGTTTPSFYSNLFPK
ncbi:MAG: hypothetical protein AB9915_02100 [Candidatus Dojkabacteria bacterium]